MNKNKELRRSFYHTEGLKFGGLDSDGLVLAADVLANSLNYLFKHRDADALYGPLNCMDAVAGHPIAAHLDAFFNWGSGDCIGDGIYRHPKASA